MSEESPALYVGRPKPEVWRRIVSSVASGSAAILPHADAGAVYPDPPWRRLAARAVVSLTAVLRAPSWSWIARARPVVIAAVFIGGLGWALFVPQRLRSDASVLEFFPPLPEPGAVIEVAYQVGSFGSGEDQLRLRARFRQASSHPGHDAIPTVEAALLTRDGDRFRGSFTLPAGVVYGAFAVETLNGELLDSRGGIGWDLVVQHEGKASLSGLVQRIFEATAKDVVVVVEAGELATQLYPGEVKAWAARSFGEQLAGGANAVAREGHLEQIVAFHALLESRGEVDVETASWMFNYAWNWGADSIAQLWSRRIARPGAESFVAVQQRVFEIESSADSTTVMQKFNDLWAEVAVRHAVVNRRGLAWAVETGDPRAILRWARRARMAEPWNPLAPSRALSIAPNLRDTAIVWLSAAMQSLDTIGDRRRPLTLTRSRYAERAAGHRGVMAGEVGQLLLAQGDSLLAAAYLDSAMMQGWDSNVSNSAAGLRLLMGDTVGALEAYAVVAVDRELRLTGPSEGPLPVWAGTHLFWTATLSRARQRMRARTNAEARPIVIPPGVWVYEPSGGKRDLSRMLGDRPTLIIAWTGKCIYCVTRDVPRVERLLRRYPIDAVIVSRDEVYQEFVDIVWSALPETPIVVDADRAARNTLNLWRTVSYFVVDHNHVVRFSTSDLEDLPRYIEAVLDQVKVTVAQ